MGLSKESCVPCRAGTEALTATEVSALLAEVPGWSFARRAGVARLEKSFAFRDFAGAMAFAVRVGEMADAQDHHPELLVEWGKVGVSWWTHRTEGLHRNDFVCAARTSALFDSPAGKR